MGRSPFNLWWQAVVPEGGFDFVLKRMKTRRAADHNFISLSTFQFSQRANAKTNHGLLVRAAPFWVSGNLGENPPYHLFSSFMLCLARAAGGCAAFVWSILFPSLLITDLCWPRFMPKLETLQWICPWWILEGFQVSEVQRVVDKWPTN